MIEKFNELLGENNQLLIVRGQLRNLEKRVKETGETYYVSDIRVPRITTGDVYATSFNVMNVCFPSEYVQAKNLNDNLMRELKDNEVILQISMLSTVNTNKVDKNVYKNNRVLFYVENHKLLRAVPKNQNNARVFKF